MKHQFLSVCDANDRRGSISFGLGSDWGGSVGHLHTILQAAVHTPGLPNASTFLLSDIQYIHIVTDRRALYVSKITSEGRYARRTRAYNDDGRKTDLCGKLNFSLPLDLVTDIINGLESSQPVLPMTLLHKSEVFWQEFA
jgi:hypothetical protein